MLIQHLKERNTANLVSHNLIQLDPYRLDLG
ncbi:hypothetical protein HUW48_12690 [Adhaeribacter radiodurans]|uniref:Uncharacterized protein n=1 Tax=Adhaeribacter radiodurans TaxID=2745197 RepID=A0A7L7L7Q8_9BACT|nr:hypothetical protein HUW48_12690 [Adhaeribacter radiodurans]